MFVFGPSWQPYTAERLVELVRVATGWNYTMLELAKLCERTINMQCAFNA